MYIYQLQCVAIDVLAGLGSLDQRANKDKMDKNRIFTRQRYHPGPSFPSTASYQWRFQRMQNPTLAIRLNGGKEWHSWGMQVWILNVNSFTKQQQQIYISIWSVQV